MKRRGLFGIFLGVSVTMIFLSIFFVSECAAKGISLDYELWLPSKIAEFPVIQKYFKGLEDATGGQVKVMFHTGGSMGKGDQTYQRTLSGVNDIGHFAPGYTPGVFPMLDVFMMPLRYGTAELLTRTMIPMLETHYFDKEFANVKVIGFRAGDHTALWLAKQKVTRLADLKGLKIRTSGESWNKVAKAFGAIPVAVPTGDLYMMLQKGSVDGSWLAWGGVQSFKLGEVCKYANEAPWMTNIHLIAMNKNSWNRLPKAGKDYLNANWKTLALDLAKVVDDSRIEFQKMFRDQGGEIDTFAPGEFDKADELFAPMWKEWIAERERKGLPAKEMLKKLEEVMIGLGIKKPIIGYTPQ